MKSSNRAYSKNNYLLRDAVKGLLSFGDFELLRGTPFFVGFSFKKRLLSRFRYSRWAYPLRARTILH